MVSKMSNLVTILFLGICFFSCTAVASSKSGTIGLLIDLHTTASSTGYTATKPCSQLNTASVQHLLAAEWAVEVINNQSLSQGLNIGVEVFDSCGNKDIAMRDVFFAVKNAVDPRGREPLLGLIGVGDPDIIGETVTTLHAFNIPLVLASPRLAEMVVQEGNILTTAPDMNSVVEPIVELGKQLGVTSMALISSCPHSIKKFGQSAMENGLLMGRILEIGKHSNVIGDVVKKFLDESGPNETIALILEPEEIYQLAEHLRTFDRKRNIKLITGTIGLNKNLLKLWKNLFSGGYLVEPHMPELPDFRNYLLHRLTMSLKDKSQHLMREYISDVYDCSWNDTKRNCELLQPQDLAAGLQIDPEITFVVKAVSAFSAALFLIETEHCRDQKITQCSAIPSLRLQEAMLPTLTHLSLASRPPGTESDGLKLSNSTPLELQGATFHLTHTGHLVSNKYVISAIRETGELNIVGWWSVEQGLVIDTSADPALAIAVSEQSSKMVEKSDDHSVNLEPTSQSKMTNVKTFFKVSSDPVLASLRSRDGSGVDAYRVNEGSLGRSWATVVVAIAAMGIFITIFMLIYVLMKICDGTLAGNQSLGVILLLAVVVIYASVVLFILPASELKCVLRLCVYPIALSLCYGLLIVKVMQLRALVLLGLGGRISYLNQYIILFFIVLVQIVINLQWFVSNRPQLRLEFDGRLGCYMPRQDFLLLHLYLAILVTIAFIYGLSVLKIRRNYKEGRWITLASGLSLPVLGALGLSRAFASSRYNNITICVVLILLATILVIALFIPKMSTISKQSLHFKHKKMQADSVTSFSDSRLRGNARLHPVLQHQAIAHSYADISKNPIYQISTTGAYP